MKAKAKFEFEVRCRKLFKLGPPSVQRKPRRRENLHQLLSFLHAISLLIEFMRGAPQLFQDH